MGRGREPGLTPADLPLLPAQLRLTADALTFAEVSKDPKGLEWLWSPQIVSLYNRLLQRCELNRHTTEAAAGALQNITAGDRRVRGPQSKCPGRWGPHLATCRGHQGAQGWEPALQEFTVCWETDGRQTQTRGWARTPERERKEGRRVTASELGRGTRKRGRLRGSRSVRPASQMGQALGP